MPDDLLGVLANRTNQAILGLLTVEPTYPRRIATLLSLSEPEVARRLRQMEGLGLVASRWTNIGKNVKMYQLLADAVSVRFTAEGLRVEMARRDGHRAGAVVNALVAEIPIPTGFVGRADELRALAGPESVVVLEGMAGIGKTSLAAAHARALQAERSVYWHSFRGVESLGWLANRLSLFFAQHGKPALLEAVERGAELADKRALMLEGIDDPRVAVVLDDVHLVEDEAVRTFLTDAIARTRQGRLVLTSRERPRYDPSLQHVKLLYLGGLRDEDVRTLLAAKGVSIAPELLPRLRDEVGGHPLALNLFLETASQPGQSIEGLLDRVPERNIEEWLLQEVYETLDEDEREVLAHASVFRTRFGSDDVAALSKRNTDGPMVKLRRRLLVQQLNGDFALHEVVRNFFYSRLRTRKELHERAAAHYLGKGSLEGHLEAIHHFLAAGRRDRVLELLERNLDLREFDVIDAGYQSLYLAALEMFPREEVEDPRRWALMADEKGDIWFHRADFARALQHYDEAEAFFGKAKDAVRLADLAWKRAMALQKLGKIKEAKASVE
ncbi:MAG TPA: hypothetical protein VGR28_00295, partial [Candidatus Thermoplasmatota archaeon]|nr:hypothetical protein [Candidatus Thermoplasmatota archaeon]